MADARRSGDVPFHPCCVGMLNVALTTSIMSHEMLNIDPPNIVIAKQLMQSMMLANGCINRIEPDGPKRYPDKWLFPIAAAGGAFFDAHPELLTDDVIDEIVDGDRDEVETKYGQYPEFEVLDNLLSGFFDCM